MANDGESKQTEFDDVKSQLGDDTAPSDEIGVDDSDLGGHTPMGRALEPQGRRSLFRR